MCLCLVAACRVGDLRSSPSFLDFLVQDPRGPTPFLRIRTEFRNNVLDLRNEVIISKSPHPLLTHVTQPLVPELTDIVGCIVHFLPTYPCIHQVQCVYLPSSGRDQAPFAELHDSVLDVAGVALIIQPTG